MKLNEWYEFSGENRIEIYLGEMWQNAVPLCFF